MKWLGMLFAILAGFASFGIGCATQVNAIATVCRENFGVPAWIVGVVVAILTAIVIFGGIKAIANVCEKLVPFMAIFYVLGCVIILCMNYDYIIPALATICKLAFTPGAAAGGLVGTGIRYAIQYGVARGLFSNESGLGSAPIVAAAAKTKWPAEQGLISMTGTFIDTIVVCTMTGLSVVIAFYGDMLVNPDWNIGLNGAPLTAAAFSKVLGGDGHSVQFLLMLCLAFFAFTTILGWDYYAEKCLEYLSNGRMKFVMVYRVLYIVMVAIGPYLTLNIVWDMADIFNGLMAIPNCIALIALSGVVAKETKAYFDKYPKLQ